MPMTREDSVRTERERLAAYEKARAMLAQYRTEPMLLSGLVDVIWEILHEQGRLLEMSYLLQNGLNYVALAIQTIEQKPVGPAPDETAGRLVVVWNHAKRTAPCAICGTPFNEIDVGPELYPEGQSEPVCRKCGEKYAPELVALMDVLKKNPKFVGVLDEIRRESEEKSRRDF